MHNPSHNPLVEWLNTCPCVLVGDVTVDIRGPWPIVIHGLAATEIRTRAEFHEFIASNLMMPAMNIGIARMADLVKYGKVETPSYQQFVEKWTK